MYALAICLHMLLVGVFAQCVLVKVLNSKLNRVIRQHAYLKVVTCQSKTCRFIERHA